MCLTLPLKVIKVEGNSATLQDGRLVSTILLNKVKVNDFVLAQANMAMELVPAQKVLKMKKVMEANI